MNTIEKYLYYSSALFGNFFVAGAVYAQSTTQKLTNPIKNVSSIPQLIGVVIQSLLGVVGSIALIMFIYGGLLWMLSGGNSDQVKKGKDTFVWATIGLLVIFTSYTLVRFIFTTFTG